MDPYFGVMCQYKSYAIRYNVRMTSPLSEYQKYVYTRNLYMKRRSDFFQNCVVLNMFYGCYYLWAVNDVLILYAIYCLGYKPYIIANTCVGSFCMGVVVWFTVDS
jgi:hypothetical protein